MDDFSPERLSDRAQIQNVMHLWCRAVDRLDFDLMRRLFHPGAIDNHGDGHFVGGIEDLIEWIRGRHKTIPFSLHSLSNMIIEFAGPDKAVVESDVMAAQQYPDAGDEVIQLLGAGNPGDSLSMIAFARYADLFERRDGVWKISNRMVIYDSQMVFPASSATFSGNITLGKRNREDYIYKLRTQAGIIDSAS